MKLGRPSGRKLTNILLGLPATLVWFPICAHYLFVFGFMTSLMAVRGMPPTVESKVLVISLSVSSLCIGGLLGMVALWAMICWRDEVSAAGRLPQFAMRSGLWIGFVTGVFALGLAGFIFWRSGFNLFIHSLFITVLGPIVVFLRELRRLQHPQTDVDRR